jgi:site-specific DNA-methyltransferase (adenine-specific)
MKFELHHGDCLDVLKTLADCSVDAIVTDPPYGLSFMGKRWDYDVPSVDIWTECLRVLKPGGHLLAFAGTRTQHRMAVRIEDAGFEIRDMIAWVYGSGFTKSLDVSKAIDKAAGAEREVVGPKVYAGGHIQNHSGGGRQPYSGGYSQCKTGGTTVDTAPATEAAKQWEGWGTALKPALEPITLARRPLIGTVAANVLEHGTGGLNVDGCRVEHNDNIEKMSGKAILGGSSDGWDRPWKSDPEGLARRQAAADAAIEKANSLGRFPANFIHDGSDQVLALFPETISGSLTGQPRTENKIYGSAANTLGTPRFHEGDSGSAARFFYCAKASRDDRDEGCGISGEWIDSLELIIHNDTFTNLKELSVWEIADQKADLELNGAALPARVTFEAIASEKSDSVLSTLSYGNALTEKSLKGIRFTTSTGLSKTIDLKTLSWLTHLPTSGYTADASKTITEIGLSHAESAALQSLLKAITTNGETAFLLGANNAAKTTQLPTNAKEWLREKTRGNIHSTVKPTDLMRYLCRLITPPGGIVLDPFTGSGSTGKAAMAEGFRFIGIEREAEYIEIARARISAEAEKPRQLSLF